MRVRVSKLRDLARTTANLPRPTNGERPDKTGPVVTRQPIVIGQLRRLTGWFGKYALHEGAISFEHAFSQKKDLGGPRLIVYGSGQLITGPIIRYKISAHGTEEEGGRYASVSVQRDRLAVVETQNSIYEVVEMEEITIS